MPSLEPEMYLLITRHLSFQTTQEEDERLFEWIGRSAENVQAFEQLKTIWLSGRGQQEKDTEAIETLGRLKERLGLPDVPATGRKKKRPMLWLSVPLLAVVVAFVWLKRPEHLTAPVFVEKVAGNTDPLYFVMEDGTAVWLSPGSLVKYTRGKREVYLQGQAYIKTAGDAHAPFIVHAGRLMTEVLGTAFNISAFDNQDKLTIALVEGKIRVIDSAEDLNCLLQPGMQLVYDRSTRETTVRKTGANDNVQSWVERTLTFDDITLANAAPQLQAVYGVRLVFASRSAADCRIWGKFSKQPLDNILRTIELAGQVSCTKGSGNTVIISKDK